MDNLLINTTQSISLVNDYTNRTYQVICAAVNSKPNVDISLFDTTTLTILSNSSNSQLTSSCNAANLCTTILATSFQFNGNQFNSLTSLSCSSNSSNPNVPLFVSTSRNVSVTLLSMKLTTYSQYFI